MSKQAFKRMRRILSLPVNRDPLPEFAWPGGYPVFYLFSDGGVICPRCVNREIELVDAETREKRTNRFPRIGGFAVDAFDVNYEDPDLNCDHCGKPIPAAYVTE